MRLSAGHVRFVLTVCALLLTPVAPAAERIFRHQGEQGVIFSDAPVQGDSLVRSSYAGQYGRPTATASCNGVDTHQLSARASNISTELQLAAAKHKVDANLLKAIARVESCFDVRAVSVVGAQGLMQLMPATAQELGVQDPFDAAQNLNGGAHYMAEMLKRFGRNHELALAAYNAGPGTVERYQSIPPYPETQSYVKKVMRLYQQYSGAK